MAASTTYSASGTLANVIHGTLDKSRRDLIIASVKSNAFYAFMMANKRVEMEDGGPNITNPMLVGRNPNMGTYQYYDELPIGQTTELATIGYGWSRFGATYIVSDQEVDEVTGEAALVKLLDVKLTALKEGIQEKFSEYLYGVGGGVDPLGLQSLIPDDPTAGTIGGQSRADSQFRTSSYDFNGGLDSTNIEEAFDDILMDLKLRGDKPDLILVGRNIWRIYRQAVRDKFTIPLDNSKSGKAMYDLGFEGCSHNGVTMLYDEDCNVNKAYFINTKYLRPHIFKHRNMTVKDLTAPWTVDATGKRIVWQGNFCAWKFFRTHAVLINS